MAKMALDVTDYAKPIYHQQTNQSACEKEYSLQILNPAKREFLY